MFLIGINRYKIKFIVSYLTSPVSLFGTSTLGTMHESLPAIDQSSCKTANILISCTMDCVTLGPTNVPFTYTWKTTRIVSPLKCVMIYRLINVTVSVTMINPTSEFILSVLITRFDSIFRLIVSKIF